MTPNHRILARTLCAVYFFIGLGCDTARHVDVTEQLSSLVECRGNLSGQDVLDKIQPQYKVTLELRTATKAACRRIPLTIKIDYKGGKIVYHPPDRAPPNQRRLDRPAYVTVEVEMQFTNQDGTFQELFDRVALRGHLQPSFSHRLSLQQLKGTFLPTMSDGTATSLGFHGHFDGEISSGSIMLYQQYPEKVSKSMQIGEWGNRAH